MALFLFMIEIPKDPSFKDLQVLWESQFWYKAPATWRFYAQSYERWIKRFGADRKPRDVFRSDVLEYKAWLRSLGKSEQYIENEMERGRRFYRYLDSRELVEKDWNPFKF